RSELCSGREDVSRSPNLLLNPPAWLALRVEASSASKPPTCLCRHQRAAGSFAASRRASTVRWHVERKPQRRSDVGTPCPPTGLLGSSGREGTTNSPSQGGHIMKADELKTITTDALDKLAA